MSNKNRDKHLDNLLVDFSLNVISKFDELAFNISDSEEEFCENDEESFEQPRGILSSESELDELAHEPAKLHSPSFPSSNKQWSFESDSQEEEFELHLESVPPSVPSLKSVGKIQVNDFEEADLQPLDDSDQEEEAPPKIRGRKSGILNKEYKVIQKFSGIEEFENWFSEIKTNWRVGSKTEVERGVEAYINCEYYRKSNYKKCPKTLKVVYLATSLEVLVEESCNEHFHEVIDPDKIVITEQMREIVRTGATRGDPPGRIRISMQEAGINPLPPLSLVQNLTRRIKDKSNINRVPKMTTKDLKDYCENNIRVPEDPDAPFIVGYKINDTSRKNPKWIMAWTTTRLITQYRSQHYLQVDSTHKITYSNYPVMVYGFSDIGKRFHPSGLAIGSHDDTYCFEGLLNIINEKDDTLEMVLADGAGAITAAVRNVHGDIKRGMCWSHMSTNCDKQLKTINNNKIRTSLKDDIVLLQQCMNHKQFELLKELIVAHWKNLFGTIPSVSEFINYFEQEWLLSPLSNWYEGYAPYISNNNGLESVNRLIKKATTVRPITQELYRKAYELRNDIQERKRHLVHYKDGYLVAGAGNNDWSVESYRNWTNLFTSSEFENWEQYANNRYKVHHVSLTNGHYECSCPIGNKKSNCKHTVFIMCEYGGLDYPEEITAPRLEKRRGPGRPKKAGKALSMA